MLVTVALIVLKAAAIFVLARIAISDFRTQKIRNEHVIQLLVLSLGVLALEYLGNFDLLAVELAVGTAAALFVILLAFWLIGKVGAGDVKLLATVPLLVGVAGSLPFLLALLFFSIVIYLLSKFPFVLPESWFRSYIESIGISGRVPFGVPIAAAAVIAILLPAGLLPGYEARRQPSPLLQPCPPPAAAAQFPDQLAKAFCK